MSVFDSSTPESPGITYHPGPAARMLLGVCSARQWGGPVRDGHLSRYVVGVVFGYDEPAPRSHVTATEAGEGAATRVCGGTLE
jgi:hypothetical protein